MTPSRLTQLRENFNLYKIEAMLVTSSNNMRWLSGFRGSYGRLLVTRERAILATDSRYWIQARAEAPDFELFQDKRNDESSIALLKEGAIHRVGFEADVITWADGQKLKAIEGYQWQPVSDLFEKLRWQKDAQELALIQSAAAITDRVMAGVPQMLQVGLSEMELAWQLEKRMREAGASALAFPIIVAFGENSALPHHHPGQRQLQTNEIVLVDMGAEVQGYKSDLTRTFFFGAQNEKFSRIYKLVQDAQTAALDGIRANAMSGEIHRLAMDTIANGGYGDHFAHGLGHGLGLDIHETPMLSFLRENIPLQSGMVLTIEPGIYIEGWGGIRIEDLILVTDEGFELLSHCPK